MKRCNSIQSAGAAAADPVSPPSTTAAPVAAAPIDAFQVGWAALYARANRYTTAAMLQKWLRIDAEQAAAILQELVRREIIHPPVAGNAVAVKPMYAGSHADGLFSRPPKISGTTKWVCDGLAGEEPDGDESLRGSPR